MEMMIEGEWPEALRMCAPRAASYDAVQPPMPMIAGEVAANLIEQYGKAGLRRLVRAFEKGTPNTKLAPIYGVSHQRVQQWREALGSKVQRYVLFSDILVFALASDDAAENCAESLIESGELLPP